MNATSQRYHHHHQPAYSPYGARPYPSLGRNQPAASAVPAPGPGALTSVQLSPTVASNRTRRNTIPHLPMTGGPTGPKHHHHHHQQLAGDYAPQYPPSGLGVNLDGIPNGVFEPAPPPSMAGTAAGAGIDVALSGHPTSPIEPSPRTRSSRHSRHGSYSTANKAANLSSATAGMQSVLSTGRTIGRSKRLEGSENIMSRHAVVATSATLRDQTNHMVTGTTTTAALPATQNAMEMNHFWNNGRSLGSYAHENAIMPETQPYPHDAGQTDRAYPLSEPTGAGGHPGSGVHDNPLGADIGTASHYSPTRSPYSSSLVNAGSLHHHHHHGPVPTIADQRTSQVNSASQAHTIKYTQSGPAAVAAPYFSTTTTTSTPTPQPQPQDLHHFEYMPPVMQPGHVLQSPPSSSASFHRSSLPGGGYEMALAAAAEPFLAPSSPAMSFAGYHAWDPRPLAAHQGVGAQPTPHHLLDATRKAVDFYQTVYLPPQPHIGVTSPLQPASPPSDTSVEDRPLSPLRRLPPQRHPGQRVDVDQQFIDNSFTDNDDLSRRRRAILDDIQCQPWFLNHEKEPQIESRNDHFSRGLGTVGRSIYTVFLVEDKESNQWRCLFGGDNNTCKKAGKRFERVERAIEHIRSHLGHRPFACDGTCLKSLTTNTPCGKRFFAAGYLEDHKKRPQKRTSTSNQ